MLAPFPACSLNHIRGPEGIPLRFSLKRTRSSGVLANYIVLRDDGQRRSQRKPGIAPRPPKIWSWIFGVT